MCKHIFLKKCVCLQCVAPKLANVLPFYAFLKQIINGNCIFRKLLANVPARPNVGNRTPPQIWGGYKVYKYVNICNSQGIQPVTEVTNTLCSLYSLFI